MGHHPIFGISLLLAVATTLNAQTYTVLRSFGTKSDDPHFSYYPSVIAQSRGGYMFTTSKSGGSNDLGVAYRVTKTGGLTPLHSFSGPDGQYSQSGLTLATDGQYYGTTFEGGAYGHGTIYRMSQDGTITTLYSFHGGADGAHPTAPPIESQAGQFYGTAETGGGGACQCNGVVYRITKYGEYTVLHAFTGAADGALPSGQLLQGTDYFFYGTTQAGGSGGGVIYRVSSSGDFKVVHDFKYVDYGSIPVYGLIQGTDGNFYGTTFEGGKQDGGIVFKLTPGYGYTVLHNFDVNTGYVNGLMQATDGNLYGTTSVELFRISPGGVFTVLHTFSYSTGASPYATPFQNTNGVLYGTTLQGGAARNGVFYSMDIGLKPFVTYLPTYGRAGALVQILGQDFTSDSVVSFNGVPANATVVYPTYIRAFVPAGATSGPITVTTPSGTLTSNKTFVIHPQ